MGYWPRNVKVKEAGRSGEDRALPRRYREQRMVNSTVQKKRQPVVFL
jgi:hypothetical protein